MIGKAWINGPYSPNWNGFAYSLKNTSQERDAFFRQEWKTIWLELAGESEPVQINIDIDSFWNDTCRELISVRIGKWLLKNKLAPWPYRHPSILTLSSIEGKRFQLTRM